MMQCGLFVPAESLHASVCDHLFTHYKREGSEIARQILSAMVEQQVRVVCVTHLYELARGVHETNAGNVLFLRAQRREDDTRTYKLITGEPLPTSFGEDLYRNVFEEGPGERRRAPG